MASGRCVKCMTEVPLPADACTKCGKAVVAIGTDPEAPPVQPLPPAGPSPPPRKTRRPIGAATAFLVAVPLLLAIGIGYFLDGEREGETLQSPPVASVPPSGSPEFHATLSAERSEYGMQEEFPLTLTVWNGGDADSGPMRLAVLVNGVVAWEEDGPAVASDSIVSHTIWVTSGKPGRHEVMVEIVGTGVRTRPVFVTTS